MEVSGFETEWNCYEIWAWPTGIHEHFCNITWLLQEIIIPVPTGASLRTPWSLVTFISINVFNLSLVWICLISALKALIRSKLHIFLISPSHCLPQNNWKLWHFSGFKQNQLKADSSLLQRIKIHWSNFPGIQNITHAYWIRLISHLLSCIFIIL